MAESYVAAVGKGYQPTPDEPVLDSLFSQYEQVIVRSLLTSFGLDLFIQDRHGGDVDTIHNVRQIGTDPQMTYKSERNAAAYEGRGEYNSADYHGNDPNYRQTKHDARQNSDNGTTTDAYTGKKVAFSKAAPSDQKASLDHVVAAKEIHDDRGRVLAGLSGQDLANSPENLQFTNQSLNSSMQDTDIETYIQNHPELPEDQKRRMREADARARKAYEEKVARAYYTSPAFRMDMAKAAAGKALSMGLRQMAGFVFAEMLFAVKDEFKKAAAAGLDGLDTLFTNIANGLKQGLENVKAKYKELWAKLSEGALAGAISSVTTTLCNIFFTTAKSVGKIIRESYASLVEACKILFINPDRLPLGERLRAAAKVLAAGASVILGTALKEALRATPLGKIPVLGDVIATFCGTAVSGILSCSLLYFLDHSKLIGMLVRKLDGMELMREDVEYFRRWAAYLEEFAAKLEKIDLEKFRQEIAVYQSLVTELENTENEEELNTALRRALAVIGVSIPWGKGSFNSFMGDRSRTLVFE